MSYSGLSLGIEDTTTYACRERHDADVLCSMKIAAMLARAKGRDFYDLMFLLSQTKPDYDFLQKRCGINNLQDFKNAMTKLIETVDLSKKQKDFEHLLFNKANSVKILRFCDFVNSLSE